MIAFLNSLPRDTIIRWLETYTIGRDAMGKLERQLSAPTKGPATKGDI